MVFPKPIYPGWRIDKPNYAMSASRSPRSRHYCFTLNNYTSADIEYLSTVACCYIIYGKEVGESGTPHLQGYVRFDNAVAMPKWPMKPHFEPAKTVDQAIAYCQKDGDIYERGTRPATQAEKGDKGKVRNAEIWKAAKEGRFEDVPFGLYRTAKIVYAEYNPKPKPKTLDHDEPVNHWIFGPPGSGKSRSAREAYPDAYVKEAASQWWDGYEGQAVVIIEDFDKFMLKETYHLKIWLDRYPFPAQVKGGSLGLIRPEKIIVTSNYSPSMIWPGDSIVEAAIGRRVNLEYLGDVPPDVYIAGFNPHENQVNR